MNPYSVFAYISRFLFLLSLSTIIFHEQLRSNGRQTRYVNIYGSENFNTTPVDNLFGAGIGALNFLYQDQIYQANGQPNVTPEPGAKYDFIVIGAGTAGATMTARLSEIKDFSVLLIEAGAEETLYMGVPLLANFLQSSDEINWKYETEPSDKYCTGMKGKRCKWPRGKVMGGSSVLNYMIATRGNAWDYDRWAELGNEGWAFKDVLKYFKKFENIQIPELRNDKKYRGTRGPVSLDYAPFQTPLLKAFLEAGQELGYNLVDYNGKDQMAYGGLTFMISMPVSMAVFNMLDISQPYMKDFFLERKGPITVSGGCEGIAFLDIDNPNKKYGLPNMELISLASSIYSMEATLDNFGLNQDGTCKMGPVSDKTAVVDPTLKVIGIKGLRVSDASIMPEIPTGHTNIPTYMIAEKASDMIKQEWGYPID
ncbi:Glucose dehydrogenase [FAD, quinone] [Anthophora quadrimaculata]